jgi:hypothetical protein
VRLVAMLAWGGFGGFPRIHEDEELLGAGLPPAPASPAGGINATSVTDLTERSGSPVETVVAEIATS